jgi:hypothetical protein
MLRSRLLTFVALVTAHAAASVVALFGAPQTGGPELFFGVMFIPMLLIGLIGRTGDAAPDVGSLVGVPESSPLSPVLFVSVNSLLWVGCAYGLWLAGRWAWRKSVPP